MITGSTDRICASHAHRSARPHDSHLHISSSLFTWECRYTLRTISCSWRCCLYGHKRRLLARLTLRGLAFLCEHQHLWQWVMRVARAVRSCATSRSRVPIHRF